MEYIVSPYFYISYNLLFFMPFILFVFGLVINFNWQFRKLKLGIAMLAFFFVFSLLCSYTVSITLRSGPH